MRVLVTGASGFIGSRVASIFENNNYEVIRVDKIASDSRILKVDILCGEITPILSKYMPDIIVNCAGSASVPYSFLNPDLDYQANVEIVKILLSAMKVVGLNESRFIQLSSAAVYGQPYVLPVREDSECLPISPYARNKRKAEEICLQFHDMYGFDIRILRIFSAYGPGLKKQIFWDMYEKIRENGRLELWGTGNESRDYIYIDDLIEAIYLVTNFSDDKKLNEDISIWNVASGIETKICDVAYLFASEFGLDNELVFFNGNVREGDPVNWCADISKIKKCGFVPKTNIIAGIEKYVDWVRNNAI